MNRHERRAAAKKAQQEAAASSDKRLHGMEIRYGGRTLDLRVCVNTDEDINVVVERVRAAARGPKMAMAIVGAGELSAEEAQEMWEAALPLIVQAAKSQN